MKRPRVTCCLRYLPADPPGAVHLVADPGTVDEQRVAFCRVLEIGRDEQGREVMPGLLLVQDSMVSRRHCVLTRSAEGRCYVRDVSRNGTRLCGRRLVPNVETEIHPGETITLAGNHHFVLDARQATGEQYDERDEGGTTEAPAHTIATVLVGDIRDYTLLVRRSPAPKLQRSVSRVFEILTAALGRWGGTIKEYPGDAILAFWEGDAEGTQAVAACRAALELDQLARQLAVDPDVWQVEGFPLVMEWALATGIVMISSFGGPHPQGLTLIGEPVVLAFRLEKLADKDTGRILACGRTRAMAGSAFDFRDMGEISAKGFERIDHVYALAEPASASVTVPELPHVRDSRGYSSRHSRHRT